MSGGIQSSSGMAGTSVTSTVYEPFMLVFTVTPGGSLYHQRRRLMVRPRESIRLIAVSRPGVPSGINALKGVYE